MTDSLFVIFSTLLIITGLAHAQISAPSCSNSTFAWSFNSLAQSPCLVAAYLSGVCSNGSFVISALPPQYLYVNPSAQDICMCNTVTYNLFSACGACQSQSWILYSSWSQNCTSLATAGTFPGSIPAETRVPRWAYLDPTPRDNWNSTAAALAGDSPEVTGSVSTVPTTVTVPITVPTTVLISVQSSQSTTPTPEASSAPHSSSSKTAGIAGGVIGGVIGATLIAGIVTWCTVRRRRARSVRSAIDVSDQHGVVHHPPIIEALRLYVSLILSLSNVRTNARLI
ncbi:hypothetical protein BC826DRAFT_396914 [Russula brevipes]|nr:hypothetical protein BC826DRAFT_396914 [Russula brevipes]